MSGFEELKQHVISKGLAEDVNFKGCTEEEVAEVEVAAGFPLPGQYKDFLRRAGKGMGEFMMHSDYSVFYPSMIETNTWAKEKKIRFLDDPSHSLVFYCYDGEVFFFLKADEGDDPPVYLIWGERPVEKRYDSIWGMFEHVLQNH